MAGGLSTFRYRHDPGGVASDAVVLSAGERFTARRRALPAGGTRKDGCVDSDAEKVARADAAGDCAVDDGLPAPHFGLGHRAGDRITRGAALDRSVGYRG